MEVLVEEQNLSDIAQAIRAKTGSTDTYKPREMAGAISAIEGRDPSCNGMHIPEEAFTLTGDCSYMFANNKWAWFVNEYGSNVTTDKITSVNYMFSNARNIKNVPFEVNLNVTASPNIKVHLTQYTNNSGLTVFPKTRLTADTTDSTKHKVKLEASFTNMNNAFFPEGSIAKDDVVKIAGVNYNIFQGWSDTELPEWYTDMIDLDEARAYQAFGSPFPVDYSNCRYLKAIPSLPNYWNDNTSNYSHYAYMKFGSCFHLQEIVLPRPGNGAVTSTSGLFSASSNLESLRSLKRIVFDTQEDGTPYTANWKNVTVSFAVSKAYGFGSAFNSIDTAKTYMTNMDKCVSDDESYQRLKNDGEYWVCLPDINKTSSPIYQKWLYYSGFNHDAAYELIQSLPMITSGGTCTLKLHGDSGEGTDAGAINTMNAEEIAVAAAKGWTVTFV